MPSCTSLLRRNRFDEKPFQLIHEPLVMPDSPQRIRIGHSPDPDDAFMFYALTSGAIDTGNRQYEHFLVDIDTLNEEAKN